MADEKDPFDFGPYDDDPKDNHDEPNYDLDKETRELHKAVKDIFRRLNTGEAITNEDLVQYMRVVNFNFAAMSRLIQTIGHRQGVMESFLLDIKTDLTNFIEGNSLLEESLNVDETDDDIEKFL